MCGWRVAGGRLSHREGIGSADGGVDERSGGELFLLLLLLLLWLASLVLGACLRLVLALLLARLLASGLACFARPFGSLGSSGARFGLGSLARFYSMDFHVNKTSITQSLFGSS